ncbi:MAG: hypothetical protein ACE5FS_03425 [Paracoccaceae bacterium]
MNYAKLKAEVTTDPLGRGYSAMTDAEVATSLNVADRQRAREQMSGDEVFQQTDGTEFAGLTDTKRQLWVAFCARDGIDPRAPANRNFVKFIFGAGAKTVSTLEAARMETVSRANELGAGVIKPGDINHARSL